MAHSELSSGSTVLSWHVCWHNSSERFWQFDTKHHAATTQKQWRSCGIHRAPGSTKCQSNVGNRLEHMNGHCGQTPVWNMLTHTPRKTFAHFIGHMHVGRADAAVIMSDGGCCCPVCAAKQARCPRRHSYTVAGPSKGKAHHEAHHVCGTAVVPRSAGHADASTCEKAYRHPF